MTSLRFLARVLAIVGAIGAAKVAAHQLGWEVISLNALFTGIIAANVFLMGFLLSGVLADYKESERMPGEISACLENMAQEVAAMGIGKPEAQIGPCLHHLSRLADDLLAWFYKKIDTDGLLVSLNGLTAQFAALEPWTQATFIARLKQEQSNLRRTMTRIETIRDTSFVSAGYLLADDHLAALRRPGAHLDGPVLRVAALRLDDLVSPGLPAPADPRPGQSVRL
jgi:hypothetical protein